MSASKFAEGRKQAFQELKAIIKETNNSIFNMNLDNFVGNRKALTSHEATSFFRKSSTKFMGNSMALLKQLENGKSTQDICGIAPFNINDDTVDAGKISAYRDCYNIIEKISHDAKTEPLPKSIGMLHRKKALQVQSQINATAKSLLLQNIATKGQYITTKYEQELAKKREEESRRQMQKQQESASTPHGSRERFNTSSTSVTQQQNPAPASHYANIDRAYIASFEEKNLLHPHDMSKEELQYFNSLNETLTLIENYKSAIKSKSFSSNSISSGLASFCRNHSYEVIGQTRDIITALMKGADAHKICNAVPLNSTGKNAQKAFEDLACIINEMPPESFELNHSHGYRLTGNHNFIINTSRTVAEHTTKDLMTIVSALAKTGSAHALLQSGIIENMVRRDTGNRPSGHRVDPRRTP